MENLFQFHEMYPDEKAAEQWFVSSRWPNGIRCPHCDSDRINERTSHPKMPYRCKDCHKFFSVKVDSVMESSKIGYRVWLLAIYLLNGSAKGLSSMQMHKILGVTQRTAWHLCHRIREMWKMDLDLFHGPVEVDESVFGGKERNKHADKKLHSNWKMGKTTVVGIKDRQTNMIVAKVIPVPTGERIQEYVHENIYDNTTVYTDESRFYKSMSGVFHSSISHMKGQYVDGDVHTNGIESFWAVIKRAYKGTYHKMSRKHLSRYVCEFTGRHNNRPLDIMDQMREMVLGMIGKRLRYEDLINARIEFF